MSLNEILKDVAGAEEKKFKPLIGIFVVGLILALALAMSLLSGPKKREFTGPPPIEEQINNEISPTTIVNTAEENFRTVTDEDKDKVIKELFNNDPQLFEAVMKR